MVTRKLVVFELNEVPYRVFEHYCKLFPNSSSAALLSSSRQYETYAADQETGYLSPTKTWPTLHRGVTSNKHGLTSFGQSVEEADQKFPPIWKILTENGFKVGVSGSLFSHPMPEKLDNYAFYMPDSFASDSSIYPKSLQTFQDFNLSMSRASSRNVSTKIDVNSALNLLQKSPELGLRINTFAEIAKQLISEKFNSKIKTRRRTFQSVLAFDIFIKQMELSKPDFATFFSNHVAATMHRYWAATFPEDYDNFELEKKWVDTFKNEIVFAMQKADNFLGQLINFADKNPEYLIYVVSSMGQAAFKAEHINSWLSITNMPQLMKRLGFESSDYEQRPAMAPIFNLVIAENKVEEFRQRTSQLTIEGKKITKERENGFFQFTFEEFHNYQGLQYAELDGSTIPFEEIGLGNTPHEDGVYLTADHVPEGIMFVYDPQNKSQYTERMKISSLDIAPMILSNFRIPIPSYMNQPSQLVGSKI